MNQPATQTRHIQDTHPSAAQVFCSGLPSGSKINEGGALSSSELVPLPLEIYERCKDVTICVDIL